MVRFLMCMLFLLRCSGGDDETGHAEVVRGRHRKADAGGATVAGNLAIPRVQSRRRHPEDERRDGGDGEVEGFPLRFAGEWRRGLDSPLSNLIETQLGNGERVRTVVVVDPVSYTH